MMHSRKELADKDKKTVFARDIVNKNPVFTKEQCEDFFQMFNLYCDNRRHCDVSDILNTARTLGFDRKFKLIFDAVNAVNKDLGGEWVDFETFLTLITQKIGHPYNEDGRRSMFNLVDPHQKEVLQFEDLKIIASELKYNLSDEQVQEVINNVAGFGRKEISWEQFNKYVARKADRKSNS